MKFVAIVPFLTALAAQVSAQLTINTPSSIVQCEPVLLTWSGGTAPYFVTVLPGSQPSADPLRSWPSTTDTSLTWIVDIAAGTSITLAVRDNSGNQVFSSADTITASGDASCVNSIPVESSSSTSSSGSGAASATGAGTVTSASGTQSGATSATSGKASSASAASSAAHSATTTSSSSGTIGFSTNAAGIIGVMGALAAALL